MTAIGTIINGQSRRVSALATGELAPETTNPASSGHQQPITPAISPINVPPIMKTSGDRSTKLARIEFITERGSVLSP